MKLFSTVSRVIPTALTRVNTDAATRIDIPWFSVVDAPSKSDCGVSKTGKSISKLGLEKSSTKLLRKGTTIVSARGTVGKLAIVGQEMAMNQSCYGINGKDYFGDYFVFFQMREVSSQIKKNVHGAVFDTITKATFKNIDIPIPSRVTAERYEEVASPIMEKILINNQQIQCFYDVYLIPAEFVPVCIVFGRLTARDNGTKGHLKKRVDCYTTGINGSNSRGGNNNHPLGKVGS